MLVASRWIGSASATPSKRSSMSPWTHAPTGVQGLVGLVPPVLFGKIDAAQIGTIGQALLTGKTEIFPDAPEQIGARLLGSLPEPKAEK